MLTFVRIAEIIVRMANKTDIIASMLKGLSVIEAFRAERPRLSIAEVSEITGLDRATARRPFAWTIRERCRSNANSTSRSA